LKKTLLFQFAENNYKEGYESLDLMDGIFDKRPDMVKLRHLVLPKSSDSDKKSFDIADKIAHSYKKIGGELLQDLEGTRVGNIHTNNFHNVVDTSVAILEEWLEGSGKLPVTWRTLIRVLENYGKVELARDIREALLYM
jgi:DNA-binding transcriptional regulator YiaG